MVDITATPSWDGVYRIETTDPVLGGEGPEAIANLQAQALANQNLFSRKHGGALPFLPGLNYDLGDRVRLGSGEIVESSIDGNSVDPDTDLSNWTKVGKISIVDSVSQMVSSKYKEKDVVTTLGYTALADGGGATYIISATPSGYSIPLNNGLHALFCDDFNIRKFGIVSNAALDQSVNLSRLAAYVDAFCYEVDFLNYQIMNPKMQATMYGFNTIVRALIFKKPHHIKNLFIANNKTEQLQQNTSCIAFMPDAPSAQEIDFVLDSVTFDPYVADYNITSGVYDGGMHGFLAHPLLGGTLPYWGTTPSGYNFKFNTVRFVSPAISYNLTPSAIFSRVTSAMNLSGEYIGAYLNHHTLQLNASNVKAVFRDDLLAGRTVVSTLLHNEAELNGKPSIIYDGIEAKNISSIRKSTGLRHLASKYQVIGTHTIKLAAFDNVAGEIDFYSANSKDVLTINKIDIRNSQESSFCCRATVNWLNLQDFKINSGSRYLLNDNVYGKITGTDIDATSRSLSIFGTTAWACTILDLNRVTIGDSTNGIYSHATVKIPTVKLRNIVIPGTNVNARIIDAPLLLLSIDGAEMNDTTAAYSNSIRNRAAEKASVSVRGLRNTRAAPSFDFFFLGFMDASLSYSESIPAIKASLSGGVYSSSYNGPQLTGSVVYDPPSIAAGGRASTTVAVPGVVLGQNVSACINRTQSGIQLNPYVSSPDVVTVEFINGTAAAIDLLSLTLTVKVV